MDYKRQKFVVFGLSSSGMAVSEFLISKGAKTYLYEELESERISQNIDYLLSKGAILIDKNDYKKASEIADVLVLSPGVPINHPLAVECKRLKKRIIGELELAYLYAKTENREGTISALREAMRFALMFDRKEMDGQKHTSPLFKNLTISYSGTKNYTGNTCTLRLQGLKSKVYDFIREDAELIEIQKMLEANAE